MSIWDPLAHLHPPLLVLPATVCPGTFGLLAVVGSLRPGRLTLLCLAMLAAFPAAVQLVPPAPDGVPSARYLVSHYPWREPVEHQHLHRVCRDRGCRISLLCPWRGPQGLYQTTSHATLNDVWQHYEEPGRPQELVPVWPGLTADRLWFVPRAHIAGMLVCVVAHQDTQNQALVLPARFSPARLLQTIRYMTGWTVDNIGLPLGLQSQVSNHVEATCLLRDGDVLDALSAPDQRRPYVLRSQSDIKSHVLWPRHMTFQQPTFIRIWTPRIRPSILLCIAAGEHWDPELMSFTGEFRHNHPGRWVPVPWAPCRLPHFVQAAEEADCANILLEEPCGVHCVTMDCRVTPHDITFGTPEHSRGVRVLGNLHIGAHAPLNLRDGDVVVTHVLDKTEDSAWPDLRSSVHGAPGVWALRFVACLFLPAHRLGCLSAIAATGVAATPRPAAIHVHGRSRSPHRDATSRCPSPRIGYWRPERRHQMSLVATRSECHCQVLCPFRGWGVPVPYTRAVESPSLMQVVHRDSGNWAVGYLPVGGDHIDHFTVILPLPPAPLVIVILHWGDTSRSLLLPACLTLRQAHDYMLAQGDAPGLQVSGPPSLRRVGGYEDEEVRLRHGDTFELETGPWHPRARHREALPVSDLQHLPHLNVWHMRVVVQRGGWASVWGTSVDGTSCHTRHWIPDGSLWSPKWLQFSVDGRPLSQSRWVPTAFLPEYEVGFVEQPDPLAVHVLLYQHYDPTATLCRRLLLEPSAERSAINRISEEWQLRPDLQIRVSVPWPRNGDVMVPRIQRTALQASLLSASLAGFAFKHGSSLLWMLCLLSFSGSALADQGRHLAGDIAPAPLLASIPSFVPLALLTATGRISAFGLLPCAVAMVRPTVEQQQIPPVLVGKFPWRDPPHCRVCGDTGSPGVRARLLSPFCGDGEEVDVAADTLLEDLRISLTGAEPYWHSDIMPVWPSLWPQTSMYVPIPTGGDLVCIVVVSPEWQFAALTPRRADLEWLLAYLRRITPGPVLSLYPPLAACPVEASQAVDWRSGDVLLAFQCGSAAAAYELPVFVSPAHVRHAAIWNYDFVVQCEVPLLMWRVGRRPSVTTMPPPARWVASEQTFTGRFGTKYPGRWAPVPWAHTEHVALCQSADSPEHCNIIFETCINLHLSGECLTVSTSSSKYSLSQLTGASADSLTLLGQGVDAVDFPPLRDGDVVFYEVESETGGASRGHARTVFALLVCGFLSGRVP